MNILGYFLFILIAIVVFLILWGFVWFRNIKIVPHTSTDTTMDKAVATRESWKHTPIVHPRQIDIALFFTPSLFAQLTKGLIPEAMEDKWFIFYEDGWLYIHRSWTGYGIYKAPIVTTDHGYEIRTFWVERDEQKYKVQQDDTDVKTFTYLLASLLRIDMNSIQKSHL